MKLLKLEIGEKFRSLQAGFSIEFHTLSEKDMYGMLKFQPFCFAGLNGSGKSNVLEALAAIFYHLELCVAKYRPESLNKYFKPENCSPDVFKLVYLIGPPNEPHYTFTDFNKITIEKEKGRAPKMYKQNLDVPFIFSKEKIEISLELSNSKSSSNESAGKIFLPDIIVGYSSGENEILSLPFIKNRLVHFDEYQEAVIKNYSYSEPESSLIYIDSEMSQAVLLSILLFETNETIKPLEKELQIKGLRSFRMNLNLHMIQHDKDTKSPSPILKQLESHFEKLKNCATTWYSNDEKMWLDFYVNEETKLAFQHNFKNSLELFRLFQILYELNLRIVKESIKEEVYSSKGYYTDGKLPSGSPEQNVFFFLDYFILKQVEENSKPIELLLRNFSDGEHQFLHTMGICLMLKERRSLLLLDEPETHFNPGWRAKFIKVLNDSIKAGGGNNMMKEILITSHSPFIISDCMPDNVIVFDKNEVTGKVSANSATKLNIPTFGTSIDEISTAIYKYDQSIGELSNIELEKIDFDSLKSKEDVLNAKKQIQHLGDSIEKDLVLARLNQVWSKSNK